MHVKKLLTNLSIKIFFLFSGIEFGTLIKIVSFCIESLFFACYLAVILPTLWDYLHINFGATKWFYGLTLSAFSMANFVTGPLYGLAFDYTRQTKSIILFANLFEIGGQNSLKI